MGSIINCIISDNTNGGIYESGSNSDPTEVKYCNFYNNTTGDSYDYDSGTWLSRLYVNNLGEVHNCISEEPHLVESENQNYHLESMSPCIDAGCLVSELMENFAGDPRPIDKYLRAKRRRLGLRYRSK